jgi:D-alanyl-lipoteichoic acid acyltransferase DltB (MBOAT superfamily)
MNFHSTQFGVFLLLALAAYWAVARRPVLRLVVLIIASQYFYANWGLRFLPLLWFSTLLDYTCGGAIARSHDPRRRKAFLLAAIVGNLGLLCFFKYWDWAAAGLQAALAHFGVESPVPVLGLALPVGISFYTFGTLSYSIDSYRGQVKPARSLLDFGVFVSFFPHLVAGPILRAAQFLPQLEHPPALDRQRLNSALYRIGLGLAKKVVLADTLGRLIVDPIYGDPASTSAWMHLLAAEIFVVQIYFDFSAYCDIAIGAARLFGFELPENFNRPYLSLSVREFWRRWHMTLSTWLRDYVYFPLGGSRRSEPRVCFNLIVSMVLIGLWHGATVPWLIMGFLQGVAMCVERFLERRRGGRPFATTPARKLLAWFLTMQFVAISNGFARCGSLEHLGRMLTTWGAVDAVSPWAWAALAVAAPALLLPSRPLERARDALQGLPTPVIGWALGVVVGVVSYLNVGDTPYFYFQF